jgi:hypothetical protein
VTRATSWHGHSITDFDHRTMNEASTRAENATYLPAVNPQVVSKLRAVARAFKNSNISAIWPTKAMLQSGTESRRWLESNRRKPPLPIGNQSVMNTWLKGILFRS